MAVRWSAWQAELEGLPAFAEEWTPGFAEEFVRGVERLAARKRAEREAIAKLSDELKALHHTYRQLLVFFDLERACSRWSAEQCPAGDAERLLAGVANWRERLMQYSSKFPPSEEDLRSLATLEECVREAQPAGDVIRAGFGALDECFAPRAWEVQPAGVGVRE